MRDLEPIKVSPYLFSKIIAELVSSPMTLRSSDMVPIWLRTWSSSWSRRNSFQGCTFVP
jgi:hypothetical protein